MIAVPLYVLGVFVSTAVAPTLTGIRSEEQVQTITLSFVGDLMFDRYIRERANIMGYDAVLAETTVLFASSSLIMGNLEGPITSNRPVASYRDAGPEHFRFTFATSVAPLLARHNITLVSLGNNHVRNFGQDGLVETMELLSEAGVGYVGQPGDVYLPYRTLVGGQPIVVYAYDPWNGADPEELQARIGGEPEREFVVVYAHWGEEYGARPTQAQQQLARRFIDAGADLVVGSHPHVVQPKELYRERWIYYSLGNFVFDQYFNERVRCGAVLSLTRTQNGVVTVREDFIELARDGRTVPSTCMSEVPFLDD